jgi:hypothetical protein
MFENFNSFKNGDLSAFFNISSSCVLIFNGILNLPLSEANDVPY